MRNIRYFALIILSMLFISAYGQSTETRTVKSFEEVSAAEAIDVILIPGDEEKVVVEAKGVDLEDVITEVSGGELEIHMSRGNYRNVDVTVTVTYKRIYAIDVSSAASVVTKGMLRSPRLTLEVSSAGDADLEIEVRDLEASVSSAGDIIVSGRAEDSEIRVSSAGDFKGRDLKSNSADVKVSSGGSASVTVQNEINARASSGGSIRYFGDPDKEYTSSSSGGSVRKS